MKNNKIVALFDWGFASIDFPESNLWEVLPIEIWFFGDVEKLNSIDKRRLIHFVKWMPEDKVHFIGHEPENIKETDPSQLTLEIVAKSLQRIASFNNKELRGVLKNPEDAVYIAMMNVSEALSHALNKEIWVGQGKWEKYDN